MFDQEYEAKIVSFFELKPLLNYASAEGYRLLSIAIHPDTFDVAVAFRKRQRHLRYNKYDGSLILDTTT